MNKYIKQIDLKVSICIPTYNRLSYLQELINACLKQSYKSFEICISQNPTSKGINTEIQGYCIDLVNKYPQLISYKAQAQNLGLAGNWNALVEMAKGEYIFMPGDDDLMDTDFLEKMLTTESENADVIFCNQFFIDSKGNILKEKSTEQNSIYGRDKLKTGYLAEPIRNVLQGTIPISAAIIKRSCFKNIGFDTRLNSPELEVFLKIAINGGQFYYLNEQLASYRTHDSSETSTGLTIGQYLANIIDIEVPEIYVQDKARLINNAIIPGINNALKCHNVAVAKKLVNSGYYPKNKFKTKLLHYILINLPNSISFFVLTKLT